MTFRDVALSGAVAILVQPPLVRVFHNVHCAYGKLGSERKGVADFLLPSGCRYHQFHQLRSHRTIFWSLCVHNLAGNAVTDGGLMINLFAMKGLRVDPTKCLLDSRHLIVARRF